jgi:hypothetical protein
MAACGTVVQADSTAADAPVDFDRQVQPLLTRCLACHGAGKAEAGLRLDGRETATSVLESGGQAVVPGDADASLLLQRISAADPAERMPPTGEPLTADEIEILRRWIAQGADWPPHWAYRPLVRPAVPTSAPAGYKTWARTPIDRFILARLADAGLAPSPEADRRTLLRRVSFDLIGLPPTPEELAAFLADDSPQAYERAVDRLLASPHYGERWARHWLDVAHWAETHGNDQDRPRPNAWPYRDWLIRAFNQDLPYGRFVEDQVAGDVLRPEDPGAVVATGFLATGPWDESSLRDIQEASLDREIARYLDRDDIVSTTINTFQSTTVHCARCHDHKFDPVSQRDYYALQAVFSATDKAERAYDSDPQVARQRRELTAEQARLPELAAAADASLLDATLASEVAAWEARVAAAGQAWVVLDPESCVSESGATLTVLPDGSILSGGMRPETDVYVIAARIPAGVPTGLRIELLTDDSLPHRGPGRQDNGNLHLNELRVTVAPCADPAAAIPIALRSPRSDFDQDGWGVTLALDGNPGTAWGIYPSIGQPHAAVFELADVPAAIDERLLAVRLEQTHGGGHLIGRLRLSISTAPPPLPLGSESLPAEVAEVVRTPTEQRSDPQRVVLAAYYRGLQIDAQLAALPPLAHVFAGTSQFKPDGSFRPAGQPRTIHVLDRGDVTQPLEEAQPGTLACVPGLESRFQLANPTDEGSRRAALARWLSDERNVLTWRSIVNRLWHYHFGRGIVDTPNDFGRMGSPPSHPELLDWLATELLAGGGLLKRIQRLIVTSAAYRQSSAFDPRAATVDGDNRLLWRAARTRLDAESLRDAVLSTTGLLDRTFGGPSVKQFIESPGIHVTPTVDYQGFDPDDPANFRRSVYRFVFRTLPDPFMDSLDCADPSQWTPARNSSVTALQALSLLNNRFMVRQSEHLAERLTREAPDVPGQMRRLFKLALLREPSEEELAAFSDYAGRHGLANACRVVLNSNEFMFVD